MECVDIFKEVTVSFADVSKDLRKDSRSIRNRVRSILSDSEFVIQVSKFFDLPLIANERCGRWYIPPENLAGSVYFKSTDGHTGKWGFSTRRMNLTLLDQIKHSNGAIIVDSTRRGKLMPDALSKTIPIWCAVVNLALFDVDLFFTPPNMVSRSEHSQIHGLINDWKQQLIATDVDLELLKSKIDLPIRPIWVTQQSDFDIYGSGNWNNPWSGECYPLILCTSSKAVQDGTEYRSGYIYVQGAADDHELWAGSLTPAKLWANRDLLSSDGLTNEAILEAVNKNMHYDDESETGGDLKYSHIRPTNISIGKGVPEDEHDLQEFDVIIDLCQNSISPRIEAKESWKHLAYCAFPLSQGKKGSKSLRLVLPEIVKSFDSKAFVGKKTLICCDTGSDLSTGVALVLLCLFYAKNYSILPKKSTSSFLDKTYIRQRLVHIATYRPVNPSRHTLNSVNSYLMA